MYKYSIRDKTHIKNAKSVHLHKQFSRTGDGQEIVGDKLLFVDTLIFSYPDKIEFVKLLVKAMMSTP